MEFVSSSGLQGGWEESILEGSAYGVSGSLSVCPAVPGLQVAAVPGMGKVTEFISR